MPSQASIRQYLDKTGDKGYRWDFPVWETENGWFNYFLDPIVGDALIIQQANGHGSGKALADDARDLARRLGLARVVFVTKRNGDAFARLIGGEVVGTVIEFGVDHG